jgi:hypothetical protein
MRCSVSIKVWAEVLGQHERLNDEKAEKALLLPPNLEILRGSLSKLRALNEAGNEDLIIENHLVGDFGEVMATIKEKKSLAPHMRLHIGVWGYKDLSAKLLERRGHAASLPILFIY